nr:diguanylate cyclase [Lachnospiraceae bacterium]
MKNLYDKIKNILLKDTGKEGESNDFSVLLRFLSIISIVHYFAMIFPLASTGNVLMTLFLIFAVGIFLGVIIFTYENRSESAVWLFNGLIMLISGLLSFFVGWDYFFVMVAFSTIMLVFFSVKIPLNHKLTYSVISGIILALYCIGYHFIPLRTTPPTVVQITLTLLNISLSFCVFTMIAYAFYTKYMKSEEKIVQYNKRLEQLVNTDALTTLWNRRAMNEHLSILINNHNKYQSDFSLAILDIDFFKKVNDEYGHGMGDFVLKSLSYILKTYMDGKGHVARWGGEEFLLTFENMDYETSIASLEELRARIEKQDFTFKDVNLHLTITAGIEEYHASKGLDQVLTLADEKLYTGKTSGRNRVVSSYSS